MSLSFTDAALTYLGQQISANNKVPAGQSFLVAIAIMEAEGDDSLFLIKGTYSNGAVSNLDKTFAQITAASGNDKVIVLKLTEGSSYYYLPCSKITSSSIVFADDIESGLKVTLSSADAVTVGTATASVPMTDTTWAALKALRDGGNLVPGMQYRITDYNTIVTGYYDLSALAEGVQGYLHYGTSAGHAFDVIVTADDESTLNENARAALHSGDTYFANSDLAAWELKYCLDNDATRFSFANSSGKGVIFWMKDEFGNEAGYDFKNWQFVRYALKLADATESFTPSDPLGFVYDAANGQHKRYGSPYHVIMALLSYMSDGEYVNPCSKNYDLACGSYILGSIQSASIDSTYKSTFGAELYYTFDYYDSANDVHYDLSLCGVEGAICQNNVIEETRDILGLLMIELEGVTPLYDLIGVGCNVFQSTDVLAQRMPITLCLDNTIGAAGVLNTIGSETICFNVELGSSCSDVELGSYCSDVELGNDCSYITLGNRCYSIVIGQLSQNNTLTGYVRNLEMETGCSSVTFEGSNTDQYGNFQNGPISIKIAKLYGVTIPAERIPTSGRMEILNFSTSSNQAAIVNYTDVDTKTVYKTTNGGTTWTAA